MQGSDTQQVPNTTLASAAQAFQDHLIAQRLPGWIRQATVEQLTLIGPAMRKSVRLRRQLAEALARIEPLERFVQMRLERALKERFALVLDARRSRFRAGVREPVINDVPVGSHLTEVVYRERPLLEAALRNFTADQATPGQQPPGNRLSSPGVDEASLPSASAFAALCRELDAGTLYQRHLQDVLEDSAQGLVSLLADAHRQNMLVDAYSARLSGSLTQGELELIAQLCEQNTLRSLGGDRVVARQLSLFGCRLEQIVVLDVVDRGWLGSYSRRLLLHVPQDPHGAWCAFSSLRELARGLGLRLRDRTYQYFFRRFVRLRDSQAFYGVVIPGYADLPRWANIEMHERLHAHANPLFDSLARARIEQIKDDAAVIAPPVAQLDRQLQREHDEHLAVQGWTLLYLAGMFIPVLGAVLLAASAWEMLGEVFQAIEDWQHDEHEQALDHVINVAIDLATVVATATGVALVRRQWRRCAVVDGLVPAHLEDGTLKLWNQDLTPFRSRPPAQATPDEQGLYLHAGQGWVDIDGHCHQVMQAEPGGRWRLQQARSRRPWWQPLGIRHSPQLVHNGAGAWRLVSEQPLYWDDARYLFRRLGGRMHELDDGQVDLALLCHGLTANDLRGLHVQARAPDAGLLDSVQRICLEQRVRDMVSRLRAGLPVEDLMVRQHAELLAGASRLSDQALAELAWAQRRRLFQRLYDSVQRTEDGATQALRRVFPNLPSQAARALLEAARAEDRRHLLETGRVALNLARSAHASLLRTRVVRVYEALHLDMPQNTDLARVVLGLCEHLPGTGVRWRLYDGYADGAVLASTSHGESAFDLIHLSGRFLLLDAQGQALGEVGELFEVMAAAYDDRQRDAMGINDPFAHNLRVLLGRIAVQRREDVEQLLQAEGPQVWFRAPRRLADGRVGYPLSGRGAGGQPHRPCSVQVELRRLYPEYTDEEVEAWQLQVRRAGEDVGQALARLREAFAALRHALNAWVLESAGGETRQARAKVMDALLDCWQRRAGNRPHFYLREGLHSVILHSIRPGVLPPIPEGVSFAHVAELSLSGMGLLRVPQGFLRAFPNLRILQVPRNQLTRVPPNLEQLPHLRELDLYHNQIVLNGTQCWSLERCVSLRYLNLSSNPLGGGFSLRRLHSLGRLFMRNAGIERLPEGLLELQALDFVDLSDNRISRLPPGYHLAPLQLRRVVRLEGNPLVAEDARSLRVFLGGAQQEADVLRWCEVLDAPGRLRMDTLWASVAAQEGANGFIGLLQRLLGTQDFLVQPRTLARRVLGMLENMQADPGLREALFAHADDELTCHDSAAWRFNNLEVRMLAARARADAPASGQRDALLRLGLRLWRLDQVDDLVRQDIQQQEAAGQTLDHVEVALGYRQLLREPLDLPIAPVEMMYPQEARLAPQRVTRILDQVLEKERQEQAGLVHWMADQVFWRQYLTEVFAARFEACNAPHHERIASLLDWRETLLRPGEMGRAGQQQLARVDTLIQEEQQAQRATERALLLSLTEEAMDIGPAQGPIDV